MKHSPYTRGLFLLITVVSLFIGLGSHSIAAEEETGTFSGRVIDAEGNPVAGVTRHDWPHDGYRTRDSPRFLLQ